ncbi:COMM domain-containing protein 3 isoform X1 [Osmerus mordax]|uniref:COMM domain-containing protein 3 n=1 Tax=Osmerus mordax TaxID=8014 RepID=C1BLN1_OSMMO|nr:COMM domain-containing protein 3 [Osmerus mordax]
MELSESVQRGLQTLADPTIFDLKTFTVFIEVAFRSLLSAHSDHSILDQPELKLIEQVCLKQCHVAVTSCILEGVKLNADKSTVSSCLEDNRFESERVEVFYSLFQKHKGDLETLLSSIGSGPPHVNDVSWRLEYRIKNGHVHKVNEPSYLISLNVENGDMGRSLEDVQFNCTMEQLQDLMGKMKDAAKSLEKATQF